MADSDSDPPKWQLRVLNGPLRGAIVELGKTAGLGRSPVADLQLIAAGVSRQHAMIAQDDRGRHILIDLASVNGTWVDGNRIDRHRLEPGSLFSIANTQIVYEAVPAPASTRSTRQIYAVVDPSNDESPSPAANSPGEHVPPNFSEQVTQVQPPAPALAAMPPPNEILAGEVLAGPQRSPVVFEGPGGSEFGGQLIDDIIDYRRLRARHLRGGLGNAAQREHFEVLQQRLRQPPSPPPLSQRAFCRFTCWFPATIRTANGVDRQCWIRDFGVDGAQLKLDNNGLETDRIVWLALHLVVDGRERSEVLTSRVVWTDDDFVGLAFTGPPRSDHGRYTLGRQPSALDNDTAPIHVDPDGSFRESE